MITNGHEESFGRDMFSVLFRMVVSWVYTYIKTYYIVHFKCVYVICQLYLNKSVKTES